MKRSKFTEQQMVFALKQAKTGEAAKGKPTSGELPQPHAGLNAVQ